jgi:hypothetical protein
MLPLARAGGNVKDAQECRMTIKFRPQLLALEARDVPAAFSFQLPDGTTGHGTFATPEGVDAAQASQQLAVNDLTVVIGGVNSHVSPGATAHYANGVLLGVAASGGDTFTMYVTTIEVGNDTAPIAYDAADTRYTFNLPDGAQGSISFDVPWDQVNDALSQESVTALSFRINLASQSLDSSTAVFTTAPTLHFSYGQLSALTFTVDTSMVNAFPYLSLSATNGVGGNLLIATNAAGPMQPVAMPVPASQTILYFSTAAADTKDTVLATGTVIRVRITAGTFVYTYEATTVAGDTVGDVTEQIAQHLKLNGWDVATTANGKSLIVDGRWTTDGLGRRVKYPVATVGVNYSTATQPLGPKTVGAVQLMVYEGGQWKPKP